MKVKMFDLTEQYTTIRREIRAAIDVVCDSQALILGPAVEKFEKNLAAYCGTKHAIGVTSGTDAILCALMAMDIGPGDEVLCPAFTFFATAGCIHRLGARPVFVDIEPDTFNIDVADAKRRLTPKTKAILPVHLFGQCADMTALNEFACAHGLLNLEDAAQAIGATHAGKRACSIGFAGCLSFYPTKNLGAFGDAGAICTNDDAFAAKCKLLRVHGSGHQYYHKFVGGMFRMAAIQAAVLDVKLPYLDGWHEARRRNAAIYNEAFAGSKVIAPVIRRENTTVYNQYCVRIQNRDAVKAALNDRGIGAAVYYPLSLHLQECFKSLGGKEGDFPRSEQASREILALPIYPELNEAEIRHVAATLLDVLG